jgi:hypothetical protein
MVNRPLPAVQDAAMRLGIVGAKPARRKPDQWPNGAERLAAFAQILGKLHFFDLLEKLRIILLDYAQKRSGTANAAFKPAC